MKVKSARFNLFFHNGYQCAKCHIVHNAARSQYGYYLPDHNFYLCRSCHEEESEYWYNNLSEPQLFITYIMDKLKK